MTLQQRSPAGPDRPDTQAARLLAVRAALRAMAVREIRHPMNPGPQGREEMDRLCILAFRGMLVSWTSVLYAGVMPEALARAAAALDRLLPSLDAGRARILATFGYSSDYFIGAIEQYYDCARVAVSWVREALTDRPHVPLEVSPDELRYAHDVFDTLQFFGPEGWRHRKDWRRLQAETFEADRTQLVSEQDGNGPAAAERLRALTLGPLWHDHLSAAGAANLGFREWVALVALPGPYSTHEPRRPLGENALRWLEERRHGGLVLGHTPDAEAERLVRIANLPDSFWDDLPAADVGYTLDDCLERKVTDPLWGTVRNFRSV